MNQEEKKAAAAKLQADAKELDELRKKAAEADQFRQEADLLKQQLEKEKKANEVLTSAKGLKAVKGSFTAKWKSPLGEDQERKVEFKDGHNAIHMDGENVPSADVISIANGEDPSEKVAKLYPWLTKEKAAKHLTWLAQIDYGYLKKAAKE